MYNTAEKHEQTRNTAPLPTPRRRSPGRSKNRWLLPLLILACLAAGLVAFKTFSGANNNTTHGSDKITTATGPTVKARALKPGEKPAERSTKNETLPQTGITKSRNGILIPDQGFITGKVHLYTLTDNTQKIGFDKLVTNAPANAEIWLIASVGNIGDTTKLILTKPIIKLGKIPAQNGTYTVAIPPKTNTTNMSIAIWNPETNTPIGRATLH